MDLYKGLKRACGFDYWKNYRDDRTPYRSWKRYRGYQTRNKVSNDSIINHLPVEGVMFVTYKFTCAADVSKNFEMGVDSSLDVGGYIDAMTKTGFKVENTITGQVWDTPEIVLLIEPKKLKSTMPCGACNGGTLHLVSIDDGTGYSCDDPNCLLHFAHFEEDVIA